jgi:hypothetical protein
MGRLKLTCSAFAPLVGIGVILALADCGSSDTKGTPGNQGSTGASSGSGGGGGSGTSATSGNGIGTNVSPGSSSGGTSPSSGNGGTSGSGGTGSSSGTGGSGTSDGGGGGDGSVGGNCVSADFSKACSSFTTPTGTTIQLGPYGAILDANVGKGYENTLQNGDTNPQPSTYCQNFVGIFGEDPKLGMQLLTTTMNGVTIDFALYSVYRPAVWPSGPIPVITWGDGTCAQPEGYGALLRYVASYGYFIVAANSREVGAANTSGTGNSQPMLRALDFVQAANMDSASPYYQKLDMTKVGAMGHSQGGAATATASSDSRVKTAIIFNGLNAGTTGKPYWTISGDMDIAQSSESAFTSSVTSATAPAAWEWYHMPAGMGGLKGHLVLMLSPERVTKPTVAWWEWQFRSDAASKQFFLPSGSCTLCTMGGGVGAADYGANSLLK